MYTNQQLVERSTVTEGGVAIVLDRQIRRRTTGDWLRKIRTVSVAKNNNIVTAM
ncbi:MAG: hypothetical protein Q8M58_00105 [Anaerolineales bacterium]|nr:hypothetical protein [Anaerolineales bacterium]MDP3183653.1 hypothetical protein [Anaerolineales bacterium]